MSESCHFLELLSQRHIIPSMPAKYENFQPVPPNGAAAVDKEQALQARGRCGCVRGGNGFHYGRVVDVHSSGEFLKFDRSGAAKPRWYSRDEVLLYPIAKTPPEPEPSSSRLQRP